jgi:hypothetical protein
MNDYEGTSPISSRPVSSRSFGFAVAGLLALFGALPLLGKNPPRAFPLYLSAAFIIVALICPKLLAGLNRMFIWSGARLQKIITPVIVTVLFVVVITPLALAKRLVEMRRGKQLRPDSYWVKRDLMVTPAFFRQQF